MAAHKVVTDLASAEDWYDYASLGERETVLKHTTDLTNAELEKWFSELTPLQHQQILKAAHGRTYTD